VSIAKAEQLGTCLALVNGVTCMRRLRKTKYRDRDANGKLVTLRRPECPKHGRAIGAK
jgi:hypothetical protein